MCVRFCSKQEERPNSDVDFPVDLEQGRTLFDLAALLADLRELLNAPVDLVESTCLHRSIRDRVLAEALALKKRKWPGGRASEYWRNPRSFSPSELRFARVPQKRKGRSGAAPSFGGTR